MLVRVMIAAVVMLGLVQYAFAGCTCSMPAGNCERGWSSGQVIFLGKVTDDIATEAPLVKDSEEASGEGQQGQEIVVQTGVDQRGPRDGDCSYPFVVGLSYLVYASGVGGSLSTSTCTLTSPEVAVGGVLRELRDLRDRQPVDSLFGTVSLLSPLTEPWLLSLTKMRLLADVSVRVTDSEGRVRSTTTNELGVYAFERLPPESYRIEQDAPAGLRVLSQEADKALTVDLREENATRIGFRADIRTHSEKEISGMVADSQGRGGFTSCQPLSASEQNQRGDEVESEPPRSTPY